MATATAKPRKQLADQLDRLDGIIDLLADGLPAAVADATRAGTRQALVELLADPDVLARLKSVLMPDAQALSARVEPTDMTARPSRFARLKIAVHNAAVKAVNFAKRGLAVAASRVLSVATTVSSRIRAAVLRRFRVDVPVVRYAATALAVGALAAAMGNAVPQELGAALGALGAAGSAFALLVVARVRRARHAGGFRS